MYKYMMENKKEVLVETNEEGLKKVQRSDDYAFLMESASIEYLLNV